MMKHKLEEDDKDTENEEEVKFRRFPYDHYVKIQLARILSEFEAFIKGSGKVNVDIDVDIVSFLFIRFQLKVNAIETEA